MRSKLLKNNRIGNFTNGNPINSAREVPILNETQQQQAALVSKLPKDFPIAGWESMNTKQQLQAMKFSGLNAQDQWTLLNANEKLSTLSQYNQAQTQSESAALAARVAASLVNTTAKAAATAKAQAAVGKPTVSTSLQTTAQQRKSDMKQEEYETRFYEKQARRPIVANNSSDTTKTPDGGKPNFDSRDAMEQKKDKAWDKIVVPTWREKREDEIWEQVNGSPLTYPVNPSVTPLPQPGPSPYPTTTPNPNTPKSNDDGSEANYNWYSSYDEAVNAWAKSFWRLSKDFEHCALIYKKVDENGNEVYTFGETRIGSQGLPPVFQPNVAESFANLYINEKITDASRVGFVHSHPEPPDKSSYAIFSDWDLALKILPGIDYVTLAPYEYGNAEPITK